MGSDRLPDQVADGGRLARRGAAQERLGRAAVEPGGRDDALHASDARDPAQAGRVIVEVADPPGAERAPARVLDDHRDVGQVLAGEIAVEQVGALMRLGARRQQVDVAVGQAELEEGRGQRRQDGQDGNQHQERPPHDPAGKLMPDAALPPRPGQRNPSPIHAPAQDGEQ